MAQIARTGAEKAPAAGHGATDNVAELRKRTTEQAADVAHEAAKGIEGMARTSQRAAGAVAEMEREVAHRSAEGATQLSRAFIELASQQTQHNLETLKALSGAADWSRVPHVVDWDKVFRIQSEYLRVSLERAARLTRLYLEVGQAGMTSAASAARRQAQKAA